MKRIDVVLIVVVVLFFGVIGGFGWMGYSHTEAKSLKEESKILLDAGNYKEAVIKLELAQTKIFFGSLQDEIYSELVQAKKLFESSDNFNQGKIQYYAENYSQAIYYFQQVSVSDINYKTAQNYINISKNILFNKNYSKTDGVVAGIYTQVINTPTKPILPTSIPTSKYIEPVRTTLIPTSNPNKDSICKNTATLQKMELEDKMMNIVKESNPEFFSFEEAKKKYPEQYISKYQDESYMRSMWASNNRLLLEQITFGIKNESEKAYYQLYNICLQQ